MSVDFEDINKRAVHLARRAFEDRKLSSYPPGRTVFTAISGGHMYGFPSPDSDRDIRGCHVLPIDAMIGLGNPKETFELMGEEVDGVEVDFVSHDIRKYLKLLMKNGGYILEQIFSPLVVEQSDDFHELRRLAKRAMTRDVYHHYNGFFRRQREIVAAEEPLLAKSVLYLFRVVMSGVHLLESGEVETDIKKLNEDFGLPHIPSLLVAKTQQSEKVSIPVEDRSSLLSAADALEERMKAAVDNSPLPSELQNYDALNDFLLRVRTS